METELVDREFHGGWARHYEKEKKKGRRRKNIDELLKSWKAGSERAKNRILELCTGVTEDEFTPSICRTSRISIDGVETEADYDFDDLGENDYE